MASATAAGYRTVLSAPYYLNVVNQGSNVNEDWPWYYTLEPTDFPPPPGNTSSRAGATNANASASAWAARKAKLVSGVSACMWSEWVSSSNFLGRYWPRAAAVAERGWSSADTNSVPDFRSRVADLRCALIRRGVPAEPMSSGGSYFTADGRLCTRRGVLSPPPGCERRYQTCG